ncbi:hypothetical protein VKT23_002416 [Stygiomarasmius scandens]|uniref:BOD1/SHG1 domain-containing protein n=1 Tax=Marasmiellus scandens TaxID=2682957 RepID=A0ABR1K7H6_9AGAR
MPISNPNQLVEEFKKSGEFDRLRRELLAEFQKGESLPTFKRKLEDIGRDAIKTKRAADFNALYLDEKEKKLKLRDDLVQDIKRFPVVERAVAEMQMFSDSTFIEGIHSSSLRILRKDRGEIVEEPVTRPATSGGTTEIDEQTNHDRQDEDKNRDTAESEIKPASTATAVSNNPSSSTPSGSNSMAVSPTNTSSKLIKQESSMQNGIKHEATQSPDLVLPDSHPNLSGASAEPHSHESNNPPSSASSSRSAREGEEEVQKMDTVTTKSSISPPSLPRRPDFDTPDVHMHSPSE